MPCGPPSRNSSAPLSTAASSATDFLQELIKTIPYRIHTVLTINGTYFTTPGNFRSAAIDIKLAWQKGEPFRAHSVEVACARHDIDRRLTKLNHPWTPPLFGLNI